VINAGYAGFYHYTSGMDQGWRGVYASLHIKLHHAMPYVSEQTPANSTT
jgi:hypothetical protein